MARFSVEDRIELLAELRREMREEEEVDNAVQQLEDEVVSIEEMRQQLGDVVETFIPTTDDSVVVVNTINEWMDVASKAMIQDRLTRRNELRPYEESEIEELTARFELTQPLGKPVDSTSELTLREEEPVDTLAQLTPQHEWPLTNWLILAVLSLQVALIIALYH